MLMIGLVWQHLIDLQGELGAVRGIGISGADRLRPLQANALLLFYATRHESGIGTFFDAKPR
jgi:hypothetical protein